MPKVIPSMEVKAVFERKLVDGHIKDLYFEQVRVYRTMFQATETSPSWWITTLPGSELPRHIFIALQSSDRLPATNPQSVNNMIFDNGKLTRISVQVNSVQYPEREFECNFTPTNRNYSRSYAAFLDAVNKYQDTDSDCQLSAEDWAKLYPIHHFDVSKHNERLKDSMADIVVRFNLGSNFRNVADNGYVPYYVYAVVLSDRFLQLQGISGRMNVVIWTNESHIEMVYVKVGLTLSQKQKEAIEQAYVSGRTVVLRLSAAQLSGRDHLGLTKVQQKIVNAARQKRVGIELRLSKAQVSKQGGFLGGLGNLVKLAAPFLLKKVLPALGIAAATGAISGATNKATRGQGLLLGKNSPFKNIPLLNVLLWN